MDKIIDLGSHSVQVLQNGSETTYVCTSRVMYKEREYSDIAESNSLDKAKMKSRDGVIALARIQWEALNTSHSDSSFELKLCTDNKSLHDNKSHATGRNKPISEKQISFIHSLANDKMMDSDSLAQERYGKSVDELVYHEADDLIKYLQ